jgi:hypothetical protein
MSDPLYGGLPPIAAGRGIKPIYTRTAANQLRRRRDILQNASTVMWEEFRDSATATTLKTRAAEIDRAVRQYEKETR